MSTTINGLVIDGNTYSYLDRSSMYYPVRWSLDASNNPTGLVGPDGAIALNTRALRGLNLDYTVIGDSKASQGLSTGTSGYRTLARGFWHHAAALSGLSLNLVSLNASGGWKLADMDTNFATYVTAYSPGLVLFYGGVNDIYTTVGSQTSIESMQASILSIYEKCDAIGARVVRIGIPPAGSSVAAYYTKSLIAKVTKFNQWDRDYCLAHGHGFVDPWRGDIHGQPTNAAGNAISANYYDTNIHESHIGAYLLGKAVATELNRMISSDVVANGFPMTYVDSVTNSRQTLTSITGDGTTATANLASHNFVVGDEPTIWSSSNTAENVKDYYGVKTVLTVPTANTFTYACTASSATAGTLYASTGNNLCDNSMLTGTTGTKTVVTGDVADVWSATATAGMTVTASQEVHTRWSAAVGSTTAADGDGNGNWQKFAITSAANNDAVTFEYIIPDCKAIRGGENYICEVEVEVYGTIAALRSVCLKHTVNWTATGSFLAGIDVQDGWESSATEAGTTESRKMVLRTPVWNAYADTITTLNNTTLLPSGTFGLASNNKIAVIAEFTGVGSATIRVGNPRMRRVV